MSLPLISRLPKKDIAELNLELVTQLYEGALQPGWRGKIYRLACWYFGGPAALVQMLTYEPSCESLEDEDINMEE